MRHPDEWVATKAGDRIITAGTTHTTRYDGVWMRNEVDKVLHDVRWGGGEVAAGRPDKGCLPECGEDSSA